MEKSKKLNEHYLQSDVDFSFFRVEAFFIAYLVEYIIAVSSADQMAPLFRKMFPDTSMTNKYGCARIKITVIGEMVKTLRNSIIESLKKSSIFNVY